MTNPTTTPRVTLTAFLLARLAEDEEAANGIVYRVPDSIFEPSRYQFERPDFGVWGTGYDSSGDGGEYGYGDPRYLTIDPARVLADVAAKRAIVEATRYDDSEISVVDYWLGEDQGQGNLPGAAARVMISTLRALAAVYADHPDYHPDWRP